MLRHIATLASVGLFATTALHAQQTVAPEPVPVDLVPTPPFSYNGLVRVSNPLTYGSGSMIGEGVMATAAHVVFNDDTNTWIEPSNVRYYPQSDSNNISFGRTSYSPVAMYRWTEYSARAIEDTSGEGSSTPNTFNMDFAVGYFSAAVNDPDVIEHAEVHIDPNGEVTIHRHPREKMIVGYPQDEDHIPSGNLGLMHLTPPDNYYAEESIDNDGFDFGGLWASVYYYYNLATYGGSSGGPVYVRDDLDNYWMMAGVLVGGAGSSASLIRSVDDNAWSGIGQEGMIKAAIMARNGNAMRRVEDLQATSVTPGSVTLQWSDLSTEESGYTVFRQTSGLLEEIGTGLDANTTQFVDESVEPGMVYHYQVQPFKNLDGKSYTNKPPKSPPLAVDVPGRNSEAGDFLNADWLKFSTGGKSSWHIEANRLRSGLVRPMSSSSLFLDVIGPGTITFDWSASCEVNEHYNNNNQSDPNSRYFGLIYDAIWLYLNGEQVQDNNEPVFLSGPLPNDTTGILSETGISLDLPEGSHRIEWRYEKDPYTDDHQDTAFLDALSWAPSATNPYPVYAAYQAGNPETHASEWFGSYDVRHWPWVEHHQLGWLYMIDGTADRGVYFHSRHPDLGYLYTSPDYWPYLYRSLTNTWIFYYEGSGSFGQGAEFYDFGSWQRITIRDTQN